MKVKIEKTLTLTKQFTFEEPIQVETDLTNEILLLGLKEWFTRPDFDNRKDFTKSEIGRFLRETLRGLRRWRELPRNKGDSKNLGEFLQNP